jgi:AP-1 complex subunit beta-1
MMDATDEQDIFRRYPHNYEGIIPTLCANLEELDEPEAKASLIWIIGEYAEKIDNADELLGTFLEAFKEESYPVSTCLYSRERSLMYLGPASDTDGNRQAVLEEAR